MYFKNLLKSDLVKALSLISFVFLITVLLISFVPSKIWAVNNAESSSQSNSYNSNGNYSNSSSSSLDLSSSNLVPLDPSLNNDKTKDRINLVFYQGDPAADVNKVKQVAVDALDIKNAINSSQGIYGLFSFGVFGIEPYKSSLDKFNFWFYNTPINNGSDSFNFEYQARFTPEVFGLDYIVPINLTEFKPGLSFDSQRSNANLAEISYNQDYSIRRYTPGAVRLFYYPGNPTDPFDPGVGYNGPVLSHELAHALFALGDEYREPGISNGPRVYPNCANTLSEATKWWGDLQGQVDPFFYEFRTKYIKDIVAKPDSYLRYNKDHLQVLTYDYGYSSSSLSNSNSSFSSSVSLMANIIRPEFDYKNKNIEAEIFNSYKNKTKLAYVSSSSNSSFSQVWVDVTDLNTIYNEEDYRITNNPSQCLSHDSSKGYRPTKESLMTENYPIFGSVNRRQGQKIANLFSGNNTIAPKQKNNPFEFNPVALNISDLQTPLCKIIVSSKVDRTLNCSFPVPRTGIIKNPNSRIRLAIFETQYLQENLFDISGSGPDFVDCALTSDLKNLDCNPIALGNLPNNIDFSLLLFFNESGETDPVFTDYPYTGPIRISENFESLTFQLSEIPVIIEAPLSSSAVISSPKPFSQNSSSLLSSSAPSREAITKSNPSLANFVKLTSTEVLQFAINNQEADPNSNSKSSISNLSNSSSSFSSGSSNSSGSSFQNSSAKSAVSSSQSSISNSLQPTNNSSSQVSQNSISSGGTVAGIAGGVVAGIIIAGVGGFFLGRSRKGYDFHQSKKDE